MRRGVPGVRLRPILRPRPAVPTLCSGRGRRIGRNLTPGTPRRIGRYSPPGTENAPKPIGRRLQKAGPSGPSLQQAAMDSGRMAAVVRALTAQVPGLGAGVPLPIPARVALAAATYLLPETGLLNRSTTKRRLGRSTFKR